MKRLLKSMLLVVAVLVGQNAWGDDTQLAAVNFSDAQWSQYTITAPITNESTNAATVNSIEFKGYKNYGFYVDNGKLTFPDNMSNNYYMGIPLSNINGALTITINCHYTDQKASYRYEFAADGQKTKTNTVSNKCDANGNITISISNLSSTSGTLFIGRQSSSYPQISSVTVTTPSGSAILPPNLAINGETSGEVSVGGDVPFTYNTSSTGGVTAESSAEGVATASVDESTKTVTITGVGAGTATIKVSQAATDKYDKGSVTYTVTVYVSVTIGSEGMVTLYSDKSLLVPSDVSAFGCKYNETTGTLVFGTKIAAGSVIPAERGVVIKGAAGTYKFYVGSGGSVETELQGWTSDKATSEVSGTVYGLGMVGDQLDFYKFSGDYIPAGKAVYVKQ